MIKDELVKQIADRQEISNVLRKYCRAVDWIDPECSYSIWNEGATADDGPYSFQGTGRGFIDLRGHAAPAHDPPYPPGDKHLDRARRRYGRERGLRLCAMTACD